MGTFQDSIDLGYDTMFGAGEQDLFIAKYDATRPLAVQIDRPEIPEVSVLISELHPNPFNHSVSFSLNLIRAQHLRLEIFNMIGQRVDLLYDGFLNPLASHRFVFDAESHPSGLYIIRATGDFSTATVPVSLLR